MFYDFIGCEMIQIAIIIYATMASHIHVPHPHALSRVALELNRVAGRGVDEHVGHVQIVAAAGDCKKKKLLCETVSVCGAIEQL